MLTHQNRNQRTKLSTFRTPGDVDIRALAVINPTVLVETEDSADKDLSGPRTILIGIERSTPVACNKSVTELRNNPCCEHDGIAGE